MMEAVSACETSAIFYETTRENILQDSYLYTRRRENMKSESGGNYVICLCLLRNLEVSWSGMEE
jgi:hypothetical protein